MDRRTFTRTLAAGVLLRATPRVRVEDALRGHSPFDVRAFGARGNGSTEDTVAFTSALAAAAKVQGTVLVPAGTYRVSPMLRVASGVTLQGVGAASVLRCVDGPGDRIVLLSVDAHDVVIQDLAVSGRFSHGVLLERATHARISRCAFNGAVVARSGFSSGVFVVGSTDVLVERSRFAGNGGAGNQQGSDIQCDGLGAQSRRIHIEHNDCASTDASFNIRCHNVSDSVIHANTVSGARINGPPNHGYGILVYETAANPGSCFNNAITQNRVSRTEGTGIYLVKSPRSRVVENVLDDVASVQSDDLLPVGGITLNQSDSCIITDNVITNVRRAGIALASSVSGVGLTNIARNTIARVAGVGVLLRGSLEEIRISGNTISDADGGIMGSAEGEQAGIEVSGNVLRTVRDGITLGNATRALVDGNTLIECSGYAMDVTLRDLASTVANNVAKNRDGSPDVRVGSIRVMRKPRNPG